MLLGMIFRLYSEIFVEIHALFLEILRFEFVTLFVKHPVLGNGTPVSRIEYETQRLNTEHFVSFEESESVFSKPRDLSSQSEAADADIMLKQKYVKHLPRRNYVIKLVPKLDGKYDE